MSGKAPSGIGFFLYMLLMSAVFGVVGVYYGYAILSSTMSSWDTFSFENVIAGTVWMVQSLVLTVAAIGYLKLGWSRRSAEASQRSTQRAERILEKKLQKRRFPTGYIVSFFAVIPYAILVAIARPMELYIGLGVFFVSIPLAYETSRRVFYRVVFGISPGELAKRVSGTTA